MIIASRLPKPGSYLSKRRDLPPPASPREEPHFTRVACCWAGPVFGAACRCAERRGPWRSARRHSVETPAPAATITVCQVPGRQRLMLRRSTPALPDHPSPAPRPAARAATAPAHATGRAERTPQRPPWPTSLPQRSCQLRELSDCCSA